MTMSNVRKTLPIAVVCALLAVNVLAAQEGDPPGGKHVLDEVGVDVLRGDDTFRLSAGMNFGDVYDNGFYWFRGGRLSWLKLFVPGDTLDGWSVGGIVGAGHRPERVVSPVFSVSVDRPFGVDDRFDWYANASAGVRLRVARALSQHFAVTFSVFHTKVYGSGGVEDLSDTGLAVLYTAAIFERK